MKALYDSTSLKISRLITNAYSSSFSIGISLLGQNVRNQVYAIYAFVRLADEIVDSFHGYDQVTLFNRFVEDYQLSLENKISTNPVLNVFQNVVNTYQLQELTQVFLRSMEMDLSKKEYQNFCEYKDYIVGSAEVVGLMCLKVFLDGDEVKYNELKPYAEALGSAFQKVNFLRDINADYETLGRMYFPNTDFENFCDIRKAEIVSEINEEFKVALEGIKKLPENSRLGVYVAYCYYEKLLKKIDRTDAKVLLKNRIRIPGYTKGFVFLVAWVKYRFNVI